METAAIYVGFKSTPLYTTISRAHGFKPVTLKSLLTKLCYENIVAIAL